MRTRSGVLGPIVLFMAAGLVQLGCPGGQGPEGAEGPQGAAGATGPSGARGTTGTVGPTGSAGVTGATGATGATGTPGAAADAGPPGATGGTGPTGALGVPCWDLNANGVGDVGTEDANADGAVNTADCTGTSVANLVVSVEDFDTGAVLAPVTGSVTAAMVVLNPPVAPPATVNASGQATFTRIPFGLYTVTAVVVEVTQEGNIVLESGRPLMSTPVMANLVAGSMNDVTIYVVRLNRVPNPWKFHNPANTLMHVNTNCITCHGDRANELATGDLTVRRWHSIQLAGASVHLPGGCVSCHDTRLDPENETGPRLRKSVAVPEKCIACHTNYPTLR